MSSKHSRVIGTTYEALQRAEHELGRPLPLSFREWLLTNNGLGIESVHVYPVLDDRDPRKTWDSIVRNYQVGWEAWLENFEGQRNTFASLLPFADFGTGDYYCFDCSRMGENGEPPVVLWSHETGELQPRGGSFPEFTERLLRGEFVHD
jgi:hypothetical protein